MPICRRMWKVNIRNMLIYFFQKDGRKKLLIASISCNQKFLHTEASGTEASPHYMKDAFELHYGKCRIQRFLESGYLGLHEF